MVTYLEWLPTIKLQTLWSCDFARSRHKIKPVFSTTSVPMTTTLGMLVTYLLEFPLVKLHEPSITSFGEVT